MPVYFSIQYVGTIYGREFCVHEKLVRDWFKQIEKLKCMPMTKCSNRGKKVSVAGT